MCARLVEAQRFCYLPQLVSHAVRSLALGVPLAAAAEGRRDPVAALLVHTLSVFVKYGMLVFDSVTALLAAVVARGLHNANVGRRCSIAVSPTVQLT